MKKQKLLSPCRPYLLRAYYHWLLDNHLTPCLVINTTYPGVRVPLEHARDGKIVLNVAPKSVTHFELGQDKVSFNTCFNGIPSQIVAPIAAVLAVYARENSVGTLFEEELAYQRSTEPVTERSAEPTEVEASHKGDSNQAHVSEKPLSRRPTLHIVK